MDESPQLTVTITPTNANTEVTWTSTNETIAEVSQVGAIKPNVEGTTTITVASTEDPSINSSCKIVIIADGARDDMTNWRLYNQIEPPLEGTTIVLPEFINSRLTVSNASQGGFTSSKVTNSTFIYYNQEVTGDFNISARVRTF